MSMTGVKVCQMTNIDVQRAGEGTLKMYLCTCITLWFKDASADFKNTCNSVELWTSESPWRHSITLENLTYTPQVIKMSEILQLAWSTGVMFSSHLWGRCFRSLFSSGLDQEQASQWSHRDLWTSVQFCLISLELRCRRRQPRPKTTASGSRSQQGP